MQPKTWSEAHGTEEGADQTESARAEGSLSRRLRGLSHSHQPEADTLGPHATSTPNTGQSPFFVYGILYIGFQTPSWRAQIHVQRSKGDQNLIRTKDFLGKALDLCSTEHEESS